MIIWVLGSISLLDFSVSAILVITYISGSLMIRNAFTLTIKKLNNFMKWSYKTIINS